jgi:hypothetical protein
VKRLLAMIAGLLAFAALLAVAAHSETAPPEFADAGPLLAQRAIDREWGLSEDSVYAEVDIPGWKSDALAMGLSAAVPGSGQWYVGSPRWWWFAGAEILGWTVFGVNQARAGEFRDNASGYAGNPADPASNWSFERFAQATGMDPAEVKRLYEGDREAFYDLIGSDDRALAGWKSDPVNTRTYFADQRDLSEDRLKVSHWASSLLWINHMISAWDALRAARFHNASLPQGAILRIETGWKNGDPTMKLAIERKF